MAIDFFVSYDSVFIWHRSLLVREVTSSTRRVECARVREGKKVAFPVLPRTNVWIYIHKVSKPELTRSLGKDQGGIVIVSKVEILLSKIKNRSKARAHKFPNKNIASIFVATHFLLCVDCVGGFDVFEICEKPTNLAALASSKE